jgi:MoaA/NifB/PqqE/SkfB family radical SAM enzyme
MMLADKKFKTVYFEISNLCNLKCSFCPPPSKKIENVNIHQFKMVIEKIADFTEQISFHLIGEPSLHPMLGEFFEICHHHHLPVVLTTNGLNIEKMSTVYLQAKSLKQINFSLQSFFANFKELDATNYL